MALYCKVCNKRAYSEYCYIHKPRKPIRQKGRRTLEYEQWRDNVARPYLDRTKGIACEQCFKLPPMKNEFEYYRHDVDHIEARGSNPDKKMQLSNVRYLCRICHTKRN